MKNYSAWRGIAVLSVLACIVSGCGISKSNFDKTVYDQSFTTLRQSAGVYMNEGKHGEVVYITRALLEAEPNNLEVQKLQQQALAAQPSAGILVKKSILGSNLTDRVPKEGFPWWGSVLLYVPNRIFDLIDLVTLEIGYCFGIGAKIQATDFASLGAQASAGEAVAGLNRRHLSVRGSQEEYFHFLPFGAVHLSEARAYTGGDYGLMESHAGLKMPTDPMYQRARDFWSVGAQAELLLYSVNFEIHTIEIFDFLCGFVFYDPLKDDLGSTRPINAKLWLNELQALKDLSHQVRYR